MLGFNTILARLNGSSDSPTSLAAELEEVRRRLAEIPGRRAALSKRRLQALRDDDDKAARKIEAELADLDRDEVRLTDSESGVLGRLNIARAAAARREDETILSQYLSHTEDFAKKLEAADGAAAVQRFFWERHQHSLRQVIQPLGAAVTLGDGYGIAWAMSARKVIADLREARERAANAPPPPAPAAAAARPRPNAPATLQHAVTNQPGAGAPPQIESWNAPRTPDDHGALRPGGARIKSRRANWAPRDDLPQTRPGQILVVPLVDAKRGEAGGLCEILEVYGETNTAPAATAPPAAEIAAPPAAGAQTDQTS